ncbi:hypothetical protein ACFQ61_08135 [Streptomyces sp. NPDC056500]|uniref:hypothetical protein n=1 Tax=Streptomyces sp. NPDC056500 TaxID=3345840 RepID=UPI0036A10226
MTAVPQRISHFTAHEALRLKHAALGAARVAAEAGNADMSSRLMVAAREYNRTVRQEHRRKVAATQSGQPYEPAPALTVPAVKDRQTVKAAEVKEPIKLIARELARLDALTEWTIVGEANSPDTQFRPLCARKVGNSVRYMEQSLTTKFELLDPKQVERRSAIEAERLRLKIQEKNRRRRNCKLERPMASKEPVEVTT